MKLRLLIELDYSEALMYGEDDQVGRRWFTRDVLRNGLTLISDEIGDEIGSVRLIARDNIGGKPTPIPKTMRRP